jgi:hypothetical protein
MKMTNKATWELEQIVKALGTYELLNTEEENKRLDEARKELRFRKNPNSINEMFSNAVDTNAINNLSDKQLNQVADILRGIK